MKRIFPPLLLLCLVWTSATAQFIVNDFIPPDKDFPLLNICGDAAVFSIDVSADDVSNLQLDLNLGYLGTSGTLYIPGSFLPQVSENAANLTHPVIQLGSLNGNQVYTFEARINCDMLDFIENGGQAYARFHFTYLDKNGVPGTRTYVNSPEYNNSIKRQKVNIIGQTNGNYVGNLLGETYTREIQIIQTGLTSSLDTLKTTVTYGPGLSVSNRKINGLPIDPADWTLLSSGPSGDVYQLLIGNFGKYSNNGVAGNLDMNATFDLPTNNQVDAEYFIFSEEVTLAACGNMLTTWEASYGCDGTDCAMLDAQFGAALSTNPPGISVSATSRTFPACMDGATEHTYTITNAGPGWATNLYFRIEASNSNRNAVDAASVSYQLNGGPPQAFNLAQMTNTVGLPGGNCNAGALNYFRRFDTDTLLTLAPGETIVLKFNTYQCCQEGCGTAPSYFGSSLQARYFLPCGQSIITSDSSDPTVDLNSTGASTVPGNMVFGATETFSYNLISVDAQLPQIRNQGQFCIDIDVPANLQWDSSNGITWVGSDGTTTISTTLVEANGIPVLGGFVNGPATIKACFGPGFGNNVSLYRNSNVNIDLTYYNCTCGTNVTTAAAMYFEYGPACPNPCRLNLFCETDLTNLAWGGCCSGPCDGLVSASYSIERTCFGLPDNDQDGCPDAMGSLNMANIRKDRAMKGDELRFTATAVVNLTGGTVSTLDYIYFENDFSTNGHRILMPVGNNVLTIVSGGNTYECNMVASVNDGNTVRWDIAAPTIEGCGTVPMGFSYQDGDEITLSGDVVYTDNIGCDIANVYFNTCFYGALTAAPVAPADRFKCSPGLPGYFEGVGFSFSQSNGTREFTGCGYVNGLNSIFCIGDGVVGSDPFPYEYRQWSYITQAKMAMPEGYLFNRATYGVNRTISTNIGDNRNVTLSDQVQIVNDTFVSYFLNVLDTCGAAPFSDGGNEMRSTFYYDVPCTAELNVDKDAYHEVTRVVKFCSPYLDDEYYTFSSGHTFTPTGPDLNLLAVNNLSEPDDKEGRWQLLLQNNGNGANNAFLVIIDPASIDPVGLTFSNGNPVPVTNGVYQLGNVGLGSAINFNLNFTYDNCGRDSLMVVAGFDCLSYPNNRLDILSGGWPCNLDTLWLYVRPKPGSIDQAVIQAPDLVTACQDFTYEVQFDNNGLAKLYDPQMAVFMPYSSGLDFVPGEVQLCYPCNPASPVYNITTPPTLTISTTLGIEHIWDINQLVPVIQANGLPGLGDPVTANRTLRMKFGVETNCNFTIGEFPRFTSRTNTACNQVLTSIIQTGAAIDVSGSHFDYKANLVIELLGPASGPVNACGGKGTVRNTVQFPSITNGKDSILIALPAGTIYVPGSAFFDDPTDVTSTTPKLNNVNGIQEVIFNIRAGLPAFKDIVYQIDFQADPNNIPCNIPTQPIIGRAFIPNVLNCDGDLCDVRFITGADEVDVDFVKYDYEVTGYDIAVPCGATQVDIHSMVIKNAGDFATSIPTTVNIYADVDANGDIGPGDVLLGSLVYSNPIAAGASATLSGSFPALPGQTCPLLVDFTSCTCTDAVPLTEVKYENAGAETTICSGATFTLGCGENVPGFNYFWSGLNGAPTSALSNRLVPNPSFNYTNTNTYPDTLDYVLATTFGACLSFDTLRIIVLPLLTTVGPSQAICPTGTVTLQGPLGFTNYQWSPVTGLSNPNSPRPILSSLSGNTTFVLSYTNEEGCLEKYQETVKLGFNCTDLELTKQVDLSETAIGDILTFSLEVVNKGPLPASGIQITDLLPSSLLYVTHLPTTANYNDVSGIWNIGIMDVGDTLMLQIKAIVLEAGLVYNCAEITALDNTDIDSTPNNGNPNEDDKGTSCTTVPTIIACDNEPPGIVAPPDGFYQWYIDGNPIAGATGQTFVVDYQALPAALGTHRYSPRPDGSCSYVVSITDCSADLEVNKSVSTNSVLVGNQITYTIQVSNDGPSEATNVTLQDLLPAGVAYLSNSASAGSYSNTAGTWSIPSIGVGETESLQITVEVTAAGTNIVNVAQITTADQPDIDSTPGNDDGDQSEDDEDAEVVTSALVASIGNYVWHDLDQDGRQDPGEQPIQDVVVTLRAANTGMVIAIATTGPDGKFLFMNIPAGNYYLTFDISGTGAFSSFVPTLKDNWADTADSDISSSGQTNVFSFNPAAGDNLTFAAGYHQECELPSVQISGK